VARHAPATAEAVETLFKRAAARASRR
jgi:hypothetical protein